MWTTAIVASALQLGTLAKVDAVISGNTTQQESLTKEQLVYEEPSQSTLTRGEWHFAVAAGVGHRSNPLIGSDNFPIHWVVDLAYYGEHFFFDNGELGLLWNVSSSTQLDVFLTYTNEREYYRFFQSGGAHAWGHEKEGDSLSSAEQHETVAARPLHPQKMPQRDLAIEAGFGISYSQDWGQVSLQWLRDVSNTFNGDEAWLAYHFQQFYYGVSFSITGALSWNSAALADYYFGVTPEEATADLPAYRIGEALNRQLKISLMVDITENWQWVGSAHVNHLDDSITRSPIVEDAKVQTWFSGLRYQF